MQVILKVLKKYIYILIIKLITFVISKNYILNILRSSLVIKCDPVFKINYHNIFTGFFEHWVNAFLKINFCYIICSVSSEIGLPKILISLIYLYYKKLKLIFL